MTLAEQQVDIVNKVAEFYGIHPQTILGRGRPQTVADARVVCYILFRALGMTHKEIGLYFDRDHSTIVEMTRRYYGGPATPRQRECLEWYRERGK